MNNRKLSLLNFLNSKKKLQFHYANPTDNTLRKDAESAVITVFEYDDNTVNQYQLAAVSECAALTNTPKKIWINIDGLKHDDVKNICSMFQIDPLIEEDILSVGQRSKYDVFDHFTYCLMYMLSYDKQSQILSKEQISLVLGKNFVLTFQDEADKDAFTKVRQRLQNKATRMQAYGTDFLYYSLVDAIVDDYFIAMDSFADKIENNENEILENKYRIGLPTILLRKEMMVMRHVIYATRDVVKGLTKNDNNLFEKNTERYLKDVYDHIFQATEIVENYREGMANLQDLYMNQENLKMNESMKVMAIVTCLLAPASVIGGTFGMNFVHIPFTQDKYGFYFAVAAMLLIPVWMIYVFKKRGWF